MTKDDKLFSRRIPKSGNGARVIAWIVNPVIFAAFLGIVGPNWNWSLTDVIVLCALLVTIVLAVRARLFGVYVSQNSVVIRSWFRSHTLARESILFFSESPYAGFISGGSNFLPGDTSPLRMLFCSFFTNSTPRLVQYPVTLSTRRGADRLGSDIFDATRIDYISDREHFSDKPDH